jgi:hypothetical protein
MLFASPLGADPRLQYQSPEQQAAVYSATPGTIPPVTASGEDLIEAGSPQSPYDTEQVSRTYATERVSKPIPKAVWIGGGLATAGILAIILLR